VAYQRRDRYLGKAKIISDTRKTVVQDVWRDPFERRAEKNLVPVIWKTSKRCIFTARAREDIAAIVVALP
jgi:hypothetical protein